MLSFDSLINVGYLLGGIVCSVVLHTSRMAQPALVYFCPIMLVVVVPCAYLRGGLSELRNLWNCVLPPASDGAVFSSNGANVGGDISLSDTTVAMKIDSEKNDLVLREQHPNV